jgi:hypothetical protein
MSGFENAIAELHLGLFSQIESQTTDSDKCSLLAVQSAVRHFAGRNYKYLEIGSYLGGSIQPHLLDDKCSRIYSIDKRPTAQPDERGFDWTYLNNSTERMMENLRMVAEDNISKVTTIDGDTSEIQPNAVTEPIQLCLIDGEHTDHAMKRDFEFCRKVLDPAGGAIAFHDAQITYNGIFECIENLKTEGVQFRAYNLPSVLFVIEMGDFPLHKHGPVIERLIDNYEGYLFSLRENDRYRRFANRYPFRAVRNLYARVRNGNVSN